MNSRFRFCCLLFVFFLTSKLNAQNWNEVLAQASNGEAYSNIDFGYSVAVDGDYAIVGARQANKDENRQNRVPSSGAAYILKKDAQGNWTEQQKIVASDRGTPYDYFGSSVAISGDYAIVGAIWEDEDENGNNTLQTAGAVYIFKKDAQDNWAEQQKIVASDRASSDFFGHSISIDGDYLVVGAYTQDRDENAANFQSNAGAAYIFKKDAQGSWTEQQKIVASDRAFADFFGYSVSINGAYLLVGANLEDEDENGANSRPQAGAVYIFEKDAQGNWIEQQKIVNADRDSYDEFGYSVAIDGDYAIVGAKGKGSTGGGYYGSGAMGAAYIFKKDAQDNWIEQQKIISSDLEDNDEFGISVGIDGDYIIVGAIFEGSITGGYGFFDGPGAAYVFQKDAQDNWTEVQKLIAPNREDGDNFGKSVAIAGGYTFVGAPFEKEGVNDTNDKLAIGSAYIFEMISPTNWQQVPKIIASLEEEGPTGLGASVDINGDYAIIGAPNEASDANGSDFIEDAGAAYILKKNAGNTWVDTQKIVASDRAMEDVFGSSVAIHGDYAIVGAFREDEDESGSNTLTSSGSAYIFQKDIQGNWIEQQKIVASDRANSDEFGLSVAIYGDYAIVGARYEDQDENGNKPLSSAGSAYIFKKDVQGDWVEQQKIVASDRANSDEFGYAVAIYGNYILVSAIGEDHDPNGNNYQSRAGSVYIFQKNAQGDWIEQQKIVASDRSSEDFFGNSVAIHKDHAIIGARVENEDENGSNNLIDAGSAYIFHKDVQGNWIEQQKIVASDRAAFDLFGNSVDLYGNYAVIGAIYEDHDENNTNLLGSAGSSYIFQKDVQGNWTEQQKIVASDRTVSGYFGSDVAIYGSCSIVGARGVNVSNNLGKAYIFDNCGYITWTGNADNNWNNANNWNLGRIPLACDTVFINNTSDSVNISNGTMAVASKVFSMGKLANDGTLNIDGSNDDGIKNSLGKIWNNGTINVNNTGRYGIENDRGTITNLPTGQINVGTLGAANNISNIGIRNFPWSTTLFTNLGQVSVVNTGGVSIFNEAIGQHKATWQENGTLNVSQIFGNEGILTPGQSIGVAKVIGIATHTASAIDTFELAGANGGGSPTGHDSVFVDGHLHLDGALEIKLLNSFSPTDIEEFTLFECTGNLTGTFSTVNLPSPEMDGWEIDYSQTGKVILKKPLILCSNITWTGNTDHNWHNPTNWNPMRIPSICDTVFINSSADSVHIGQVMPAEAAKIENRGRMDIAGTLNIIGSTRNGLINFERVWNNGTININDVYSAGIDNFGGRFTNSSTGQINIGNQSTVPPYRGIVNSLDTMSVFVNEGQITIGNTTSENILNGIPVSIPIKIIWQGNGILNLANEFSQNWILSPGGSPGTMHINGNLLHSTNAIDTFEIAGTAGGGQPSGHDSIYVDGNLATAGKLVIKLLDGFVPNNLDQFVLFEYTGSRTSSFSPIELPSPAMDGWVIDYSQAGKVILKKQPAACGYITWTGNTDNNWNNASNWNLGRIPLACDTVLIYTDSVNINGTPAVGTRLVNAGKLTIDGSLTLDGSLANSILAAAPGTIENNGTLICKNATDVAIQNDGAFINSGQLLIDQADGGLVSNKFFINGPAATVNIGNNGGSITDDAIVNESNGLFINQGQLTVDNVSGVGLWNKQTFHNEASGTMDLGQNGGAISSYAISNNATGHFYNFGNINTQTNSATDIFNSSVLSNRATWYGEGTITMNGRFLNVGIITPGASPGNIHFSGDLTHVSGSIDTFEIAGTAGGGQATGHDSIYVAGDLTLHGALEVKLLNGFTPSDQDQFVLFEYTGTLSGTFSAVNLPSPAMDGWLMDYSQAGKVILSKPATFQPFLTTWSTDLSGPSTATSITIPTTGTGYNYDVDWENDGVYDDFGVTGDITHDYGVAGDYQVAIRGDFPRIHFENTGERFDLRSIDQWGDIEWTSMEEAFWGCSNLRVQAVDAPDLSNVTSLYRMFKEANNLNDDLSNWDFSTITNMGEMLMNALSFNQNLANWDISNVTDMSGMLDLTDISPIRYDSLLIFWSLQNVQPNVSLGAFGLEYCAAESFRNNLIDDHNWTITGDSKCPPACPLTDAGDLTTVMPVSHFTICEGSPFLNDFGIPEDILPTWQEADETEPCSSAEMGIIVSDTNGVILIYRPDVLSIDFSTFTAGVYNIYSFSYSTTNTPESTAADYLLRIGNDGIPNDIQQIKKEDNDTSSGDLGLGNYELDLNNEDTLGNVVQIIIDAPSAAEISSASSSICAEDGTAVFVMENYTGDILKWQVSDDSDFSNPSDINVTSDILDIWYPFSSNTRYFRAVVQNGVCPIAYSDTSALTVDALSVGGTITGEGQICDNQNTTTLTLSGYTGTILSWEWDTDEFFSNPTTINHTSSEYTAIDLTTDTYFRAKVQNGTCAEVYSDIALLDHTGTCSCADLRVSNLIVTGFTSDNISYKYTVRNIGNAPADLTGSPETLTDNVGAQAYLATDMTNPPSVPAGGSIFTGTVILQPGDSLVEYFSASVALDTMVHPYLYLTLTGTQNIADCDAQNNDAYTLITNPNVCNEDDLTINHINFELYHGGNTITSDAHVWDWQSTTFKAGTTITLTEGFHAEGDFHAMIEDCPPSNLVESVTESRTETLPPSKHPITEAFQEQNLKVYPNPTNGWLTVAFKLPVQANLQLMDTAGRLIKQQQSIPTRTEFDLSSLPAGMYLIRLQEQNTGQVILRKVIKLQ